MFHAAVLVGDRRVDAERAASLAERIGGSPAPSRRSSVRGWRLLVVKVLTPNGHWSSYPPHKHDREDPPSERYLEETYYHSLRLERGFALQRVFTEDGSLDEPPAFHDGDVVLVPKGYHVASAPPGYDLYYLNVMAGPVREWRIRNHPDHEWLLG